MDANSGIASFLAFLKRVESMALLIKNGEIVTLGASAAVLGHPAEAIAMLVNILGELGEELSARGEAEAPLPDDLEVVVGEAHRPVAHGDEEHRPDEPAAQVGEEERGRHQRDEDERAAHGRRRCARTACRTRSRPS